MVLIGLLLAYTASHLPTHHYVGVGMQEIGGLEVSNALLAATAVGVAALLFGALAVANAWNTPFILAGLAVVFFALWNLYHFGVMWALDPTITDRFQYR